MQIVDQRNGVGHAHHEVGARETEQHRQLVLVADQRVDVHAALIVEKQRQRNWPRVVVKKQPADDQRHLVPVEGIADDLDPNFLGVADLRPVFGQRAQDVADVAFLVLPLARQGQVAEDAPHHREDVPVRRVCSYQAGLVRVLNPPVAAGNEHVCVADVRIVADVAIDRVVERFRERAVGKPVGLVGIGGPDGRPVVVH